MNHSTDCLDSGNFAEHQLLRFRAIGEICGRLRTHFAEGGAPCWPTVVLPYVADIAFSDGAAFITATEDGRLEIRQAAANTPGEVIPLSGIEAKEGLIWQMCRASERSVEMLDSFLPRQKILELGLDLPDRSSVMALRIKSDYNPDSALCVWRSPGGNRRYSAHPYQVWDQQEFHIAADFVSVAIDLREYIDAVGRLQSVQDAARSMLDVIKPISIEMYNICRVLQEPAAHRLESCIEALESGIDGVQRSLMFQE